MPEDLRDLRYGSAVTNHFGCQSVSEQVSSAATGTMNIGSHERPSYDVSNRRRTRQTGLWRQSSQENSPRGGNAAILAKIGSQSLADLRQKWQPIHSLALAVDHDLSRSPEKVIEFKCDDLPGAQAKPGKQENNRVIPTPGGCRSICLSQDAFYFFG
jgi:hypothetical protein